MNFYILFIIANKFKFRLLFIFIFLLFILFFNYKIKDIIIKKKFFSSSDINQNSISNTNLTEKEEKDKILLKGRKYLDKCLNSHRNIFHQNNEKPAITTIIPSYNCEKTITSSIYSVQYQNFTNFEIIIVDDFSKDKSKEIIKNIQLTDKRLELIENKKNMGTLYSRCIGALLSKGKYIYCLDNDDLFFDEDVFEHTYKKSIMDNLDILSFRSLFINNYFDGISKMKDFHFFNTKNNLFLSQPDLGIWTLTLNGKYRMHNNMIWSKAIKTYIYKKAVNMLGIKRYSKYVCWAEDTSINFIIFNHLTSVYNNYNNKLKKKFNIASTFRYIYKLGYIHVVRKSSATYSQTKNL